MANDSNFNNVVILDGSSLHAAGEQVSERAGSRISVDYSKFKRLLNDMLLKANERLPETETAWKTELRHLYLLAQDPKAERQQRFQSMLEHNGYDVDVTHYRDTFVSPNPGQPTNDGATKPITTFATKIAYIAGLLSAYEEQQLVVVSHSYELFEPLHDLARRVREENCGRVGLAFFGSLLDYRWRSTGILNSFGDQSCLEFFDLDLISEDLLGVDLQERNTGRRPGMSMLDRI